jgi:hypothetical protein
MVAYIRDFDGAGYLFIEETAVGEMLWGWPLSIGEGEDGNAEVTINLNDLFVPGADDEPLMFSDIEPLYIAFCDPRPNAVRDWLCRRYNDRPWREKL